MLFLIDVVSLCRFKEIPAVHKEVSRLVRMHPTAVSDLPEALQVRWNPKDVSDPI